MKYHDQVRIYYRVEIVHQEVENEAMRKYSYFIDNDINN
jgi:hypothetical protein